MADAASLAPDRSRDLVLSALRRLDGRATIGDVTAATGLVRDEAERQLRALLEHRRGHLEVGTEGDLVYRFDRRLISREAEPLASRMRRLAWRGFVAGFKIWIMAMLLIYFVVFVALLLAALFAGNRDGDDSGGWGEGRGRRGGGLHLPMGDFWLWYWLWSPDWGRRRRYYGEGYGDRGARGRKGPPFYRKVFAFVFGPDEPQPSMADRDLEHLRFIRARRGVVSATDFVQYSGMTLTQADEELARLMAAHQGDVEVTDDGTITYLFPELMVSAHGPVRERAPVPAWQRLETRRPLTGNASSTNVLIAGLNGFNLLAAAAAPAIIFPRLGIGGPAAEIALIWVPLVFSATFFAVPLLRMVGVARDNAQRGLRNVRRVILGLLSREAPSGSPTEQGPVLDATEARHRVDDLLAGKLGAGTELTPVLDEFVAEFDGEVEIDADGRMRLQLPLFRTQLEAARRVREQRAFDEQQVGAIVFDTDDDSAAASRRDLDAFDARLAAPLETAERDERAIAAEREARQLQAPAPEFQNTRTENRSRRPMRGRPH